MAIPESQLETWSHQGSVIQSSNTYDVVKRSLEDPASPFYAKNFEVHLQGSYANSTNVYRDSDVDLIIRLDSIFYHDAETLPTDQQAIFHRKYPGVAAYSLSDFKAAVASWLRQSFGRVEVGDKAIFIPGSGGRRDCDVLPCAKYKYLYSVTEIGERADEGICFFLPDGTKIVNFPKQHRANCTTKHQETNQWFKPTVRILKNMRNYLIDNGLIHEGIAPSYFIEGMLWNVPNSCFGRNYQHTFVSSFDYIISSDLSAFKCANGIHKLLGTQRVNWRESDCQEFLDGLRRLWVRWPEI